MAVADVRSESPWLLRPRDAAAARLRLLCFPYAGGGTWIYREWSRHLAPEIAVHAIKLPGRGDRFREPPATDLRALAGTLADALREAVNEPFAVFGHSMGALLAYEFVCAVAARGGPAPVRLFVSAAVAPPRVATRVPLHRLPDAAFVQAVLAKYAHPALRQAGPEVLELLLPALRGDMQMFETYHYQPTVQLACPLSIYVGRTDPVSRVDLESWRDLTDGPATLAEWTGAHFYLHESESEVLADIRRLLC